MKLSIDRVGSLLLKYSELLSLANWSVSQFNTFILTAQISELGTKVSGLRHVHELTEVQNLHPPCTQRRTSHVTQQQWWHSTANYTVIVQYSSAPFTCTAVYVLSKSFCPHHFIVGICVHYLCFALRENFYVTETLGTYAVRMGGKWSKMSPVVSFSTINFMFPSTFHSTALGEQNSHNPFSFRTLCVCH
jgi:hypothetical protein